MPTSPNELNPDNRDALTNIIGNLDSPVEKAAFKFFYNATVKEGIETPPGYTWDQFDNGVAPFNGVPIEVADSIVIGARDGRGLVTNYTSELAAKNGLENVIPLTEALTGPFVRSLHKHRQRSAVRIVGIHPSMATPFVIARSLAAAYEQEYEEDIRPHINIVVGAYPTVMNYDIDVGAESPLRISPVDFGRFLGNLVLTAPKTASTDTDEGKVQDWMNMTRANFKVKNREIMATPGEILIVHPAGRRGRRSTAKVPPFNHTEYRPDSGLAYITDVEAPTFVIGVDDNLLNDPHQPQSEVNIFGDPRPYRLTNDKWVIDALKHSAALASHGATQYRLESRVEHAARLGLKVVGLRRDSVES